MPRALHANDDYRRRGEGDALSSELSNRGFAVRDMRTMSCTGTDMPTCDGGDVMWTGRHLIVGLSARTNDAGALCVKEVFQAENAQTLVVPCLASDLHLKCAMTHVDGSNLVVADTANGHGMLNAVQELVRTGGGDDQPYNVHLVTNALAANVVRVNSTLVVPEGVGAANMRAYEAAAQAAGDISSIVQVANTEFVKCDGSLTCRSILLRQ